MKQYLNYNKTKLIGGKSVSKAKTTGKTTTSGKSVRPALTPEARENQMIALAMDLAEQQLRDGTASSQLITEFVKRGSTKARLEKEILAEQKELISEKTRSLRSAEHVEELYKNALNAFRGYSGQEEENDDNY
jgi:ribosomal protein L16 Arg81 hydroxylase